MRTGGPSRRFLFAGRDILSFGFVWTLPLGAARFGWSKPKGAAFVFRSKAFCYTHQYRRTAPLQTKACGTQTQPQKPTQGKSLFGNLPQWYHASVLTAPEKM
jgi:hypothetical protein